MFAFKMLGLQHRVRAVFCSDTDPRCQQLLRRMHKPQLVYNDVRGRDVKNMPGNIDIYVAGFPCQPWSSAGLRAGKMDKYGRGTIFEHILTYIKQKKPRCFILENVRGLTDNVHRPAFLKMLESLREGNIYSVTWRILNTLNYGIPQNRPRLFIIGFLNASCTPSVFRWPAPGATRPPPFEDFLRGGRTLARLPAKDTRNAARLKELLTELKRSRADFEHQPFALDIFARRMSAGEGRIPCLTRTAGGRGGFYITSKKRFLTLEEMLRLQGLPTELAEVAPKLGITDRQVAQMVGNAISTNILQLLLPRTLHALGLHQ